MTHSFVTIALAFDSKRADAVRTRLEAMGNPAARPLREGMREDLVIHFMSINVIDDAPRASHLVIEASSDARPGATVDAIVRRLPIRELLDDAGLGTSDPAGLLKRRIVTTGTGLRDVPGLNHTGTPGMTVRRIRDEYELERRIRDLFDANNYRGTAIEIRDQVRRDLQNDPKYAPLLTALPTPFLRQAPGQPAIIETIAALAPAAVANFLWPVLVPALAFSAIWVWLAWRSAGWAVGLLTFVAGFAVTVVLLLLSAFLIYRGLRKREESDAADNSLPNEQVLSRIVADENKAIQNHMTGVSIMKPGRLRRFTLRLAFWVIGALAGRQFRPGYLADIGTIHFARWVLLPGTDKLLFFSNYGGSWESYLEDFITKAHDGLTAVWSNTLGFPKARNLFFDGATDGDRFKRWARRQHRPTAFWYSAYPNLSTDRIRSNAALRQGLVCAATEDEAQAWLSLLGSRTPPAALIETPEVQTIVFGGLKKHPFSACLLLSLPADRSAARAWLRLAKARASFGDQPGPELVGLLALAVGGLRKLGLGERDIASFPQAYRDGIAHPSRSKILGDTGDDKPAEWIWGNDSKPADAALVLYAASARLLRRSLAEAVAEIERAGGAVVHRVPLRQLAKGAQLSAVGARNQEHEAFGFADGVSQPIIKGTRRWLTDEDQIHSVEPGEFLLGYPANRGYLPLTPTVPAEADPSNLLTVPDPAHGAWPVFERSGANSDRDLGRNGSFLVVRQLGQDVAGFKRSVAEVAAACADHRGIPPGLDQKQREQWIAAKIIGRWRDGTSLVRYPHRPGTGWNGEFPHVEPDNAFLLGAEDPVGHRCPFGSHIRRTNPRDSFTPGSMEQLAITNRHRILRMGRRYDAYRHDGRREPEGLFFMCLNADLERQFEFIQQTWSMALQFHGLENEVDPILGRGLKTGRLTIPTPYGPIQVKGLGDVVQVRGGGYFFLPGRRALEWLAA